jgi:WhiB family redox-sensing transcriptional regulator
MSVLGSCSAQPAPEPPGWQSAAACAGLPPKVVFSKKVKEAAPALRACAGCTVRRRCEEAVAPAESWFDGVCGGRLWRSGRPVPLAGDFLTATPGGAERAKALRAAQQSTPSKPVVRPMTTRRALATRPTTATRPTPQRPSVAVERPAREGRPATAERPVAERPVAVERPATETTPATPRRHADPHSTGTLLGAARDGGRLA